MEAERLLGISGKADILAMGIEKFNQACRESVLRYTREWRDYVVAKQARWVDFDNDYKTLDLPYMESVMWAFKQLWDKGLVYQGFKSAAVLLAVRDAQLSNPRAADGRATPTPNGRTRRSRSGSSWRPGSGCWRLDHHAVDAAVQPGPLRGRRGHQRYVVVAKDGRAVHPGQGPAGRL